MIHAYCRPKSKLLALAFIHLWALASSARPEDDQDKNGMSQANANSDERSACPVALPWEMEDGTDKTEHVIARYHEFWLSYDAAKRLDFFQQFHVQGTADCNGSALGEAWVVPVLDDSAPLSESGASINVKPSLKLPYGSDVFICQTRHEGCIASLTLQSRPFHALEYAEPLLVPKVFGEREWAMYLFSTDWDLWLMEGLLFVLLASFVITIGWYVYTMVHLVKSYAARDRVPDEQTSSDTNIKLLATWNVVFKTGKECAIFTLGSVVLTYKAESFLLQYGDSQMAQSFVTAFPLICGPWVILRFFRITVRSGVYYTCLRQGILVEFSNSILENVPFLFCLSYVFVVILIAIYAALHGAGQDYMQIALDVFAFASPSVNIFNAVNNMNILDRSMTDMECTLKCGKMSTEEATPIVSSLKVKRVPADVLIERARSQSRSGGQETAQRGTASPNRVESTSSLPVGSQDFDLYEASKFVAETLSFMWRCLFLFWLPSLTAIGLCLGCYGSIDYLRDRVQNAKLNTFETLTSDLFPPLQPELSKYTILTMSNQVSVAIAAEVDPDRTRELKVELPLNGQSTSPAYLTEAGFFTEAVLKQPEYPVRVNISVRQGGSLRRYRMQLITSNVIPATVLLQGVTSEGAPYQRCIPWNMLKYNWVYVPSMLSNVTVKVSMTEFAMVIPEAEPANDSFTTVFIPGLAPAQCKQRCHAELSNEQNIRRCRVQRPSKTGCYILYEPRWRQCMQTHERTLASSPYHQQGTVVGKVCGGKGSDCLALQPSPEGWHADITSMFNERNEHFLFMEFFRTHSKSIVMMGEDRVHVQIGGQHFPYEMIAFVDNPLLHASIFDGYSGAKRVRVTVKESYGPQMPAGSCNASMFAGYSLYLLSFAEDGSWKISWNNIQVRVRGSSNVDAANNSLGEDISHLAEIERWPGSCDSKETNFLTPCHGIFPATVTRLSLSAVCGNGEAQRLSLTGVATCKSFPEQVKLQADIFVAQHTDSPNS